MIVQHKAKTQGVTVITTNALPMLDGTDAADKPANARQPLRGLMSGLMAADFPRGAPWIAGSQQVPVVIATGNPVAAVYESERAVTMARIGLFAGRKSRGGRCCDARHVQIGTDRQLAKPAVAASENRRHARDARDAGDHV